MSKVIGIFAPVGSGKSLVLDILKNEYGAYIIQTDKLAHGLYEADEDLKNKLVSLCGAGILSESLDIDRSRLGEILYKDKALLAKVNELVHPTVWKEVWKLVQENKKKYRIIAVESAVLPKDTSIYDEIWYIDVAASIRYERLQESRNYSKEKTDSIISNQALKEVYIKAADKIIYNNKTKRELKEQIYNLLGDNEIL